MRAWLRVPIPVTAPIPRVPMTSRYELVIEEELQRQRESGALMFDGSDKRLFGRSVPVGNKNLVRATVISTKSYFALAFDAVGDSAG